MAYDSICLIDCELPSVTQNKPRVYVRLLQWIKVLHLHLIINNSGLMEKHSESLDQHDSCNFENTQDCADVVLSDFENSFTSQNFLSTKDFLLQTQAIV